MLILGIDPGYAIIGYGVLDYKNNHFTVVDYGAITTEAGVPFNRRLEIIYDELTALIEIPWWIRPECVSSDSAKVSSTGSMRTTSAYAGA